MMEDRVRPVYARGVYTISEDGLFNWAITYEYEDPDEYYASLEDVGKELRALRKGMESVLKEERVVFNGKEVKPTIVSTSLSFPYGPKRPALHFVIQSNVELKKDNTYENLYESGMAEYGYEALWILPPRARVVEVVASGIVERTADNIIFIKMERGLKYEGYEMIRFVMKASERSKSA